MNKQINIREALDWYLWAGVNETCGDCRAWPARPKSFSLRLQLKAFRHKFFQANRQADSRPAGQETFLFPNLAVLRRRLRPCSLMLLLQKCTRYLCQSIFSGRTAKHRAEFWRLQPENTAASTVFGDGAPKAKLLLIGEAPGADEDRIGRPFVGRCGKLLDKMLAAIHVNRPDCYITNVCLGDRRGTERQPMKKLPSVCHFLRDKLNWLNLIICYCWEELP